MNKTIILGYFTRDIEKKVIEKEGKPPMTIYTSGFGKTRKFKKRDGSIGKEVMFINITFYGQLGLNASKYFKKGSPALLEGRLQFSSWQDKNNPEIKRSKHNLLIEKFDFVGIKTSETKENKSKQDEHNKNDENVATHLDEELPDERTDEDYEKDAFFPADY